MEVGVRLVGIILRLLNFLMMPVTWFLSRSRKTVPPPRHPVLMISATKLAEGIRNGEYTSEEIVSIYIDRVKEVDPYIHAVVEERFKAALDEAKIIDRDIAEARKNGTLEQLVKDKPLLGVPFTVKESCSLAGLSNSVGCVGARSVAPRDGACVSLARRAGGVPLLVSNTPELCLGWESSNLVRPATNNPYDLRRTPAGSSGGEAALVSSAASPLSVSSDIAGSIRLPAAFCGVFGHKPTPGILSIEGHIPWLRDAQFPRFLSLGPLARHAEDLPLALRVLAGAQAPRLRLDEPVDMKGVKVLYMTEATKSPALIPVESCIKEAILNSVRYLEKECGCTVSEEKFHELEDSVEISVSVFFSMKDIPDMLQDPADPKVSLNLFSELLRHILGGASRSLQALCFALLQRTKLFIPRHRNKKYSDDRDKLQEKMTRVLGDNGVLIYPVFNERAHHHNQVFVRAGGVMYPMVFNILGAPATAVPLGAAAGLPVAVQVIAAPYQDRLCLAVAKELEKGFGGWRPPR